VVPDLAVEVVSPNDEFSDVPAKVREYFDYGVRRVWVIAPEERQVYVYESPTQVHILPVTGTLSDGDLFPGFALPLASLFAHGFTLQSS
jgi:Uma2 family endonuclease